MSTLQESAHSNLKEHLDWDNGADLDLNKIADSMRADWEVTLSAPLGLTREEIEDVKASGDPKLVR